jgi:hypothetical protein
VKKKFEEISKNTTENIPITTSDPSKRDRELYITNLIEGLQPADVSELMNTAMQAIGAITKSGNPIISVWMDSQQNCSFLEFRSAEEATNAFKLNGMDILGKVKVYYSNILNIDNQNRPSTGKRG